MQTPTRAGTHRSPFIFGFLTLLALFLAGCGTSTGSANQLDAHQVFTWPLIHVPSFTDLTLVGQVGAGKGRE